MDEIWKDIEGYEGLYKISNLGKVKSLNYHMTGKERILKPGKDNHGYLFVILYKEGKHKTCTVHRLVAEAFIPNPDKLPCVNHKDENPLNNNLNNLEWCTHKYNINYGTAIERAIVALTNRKDMSKPVKCLETGKIYPSTIEAQRETGIRNGNISHCCLGNRKTAGGYHWRYI